MKNPRNRKHPVEYPSDCQEMPPFTEWFERTMTSHHFESSDENRFLLTSYSIPPSLKVVTYKACRAYGNHWRAVPLQQSLVDCDSSQFQTFDSGMAATFSMQRTNRAGETIDDSVQYVGVLTEVLELNYGGMKVVLFKGRWIEPSWVPKSSASMRYHESGLWQVNFQKELGASKRMDYVFPRQVEQVFFYPNDRGIAWRTVLHKESRSTRVLGDFMEVPFHDSVEHTAKHHISLAEACRSRSQPSMDPKRKRKPRNV